MELGAGGAGVGPADVVTRWIRWEFGGGCVRKNVLQFIFLPLCAAFVTTDTSTELLRDLVKPAEI